MSNYQNQCIAINILLVEDNPGDIRLTQEALKDGKIKNKLDVVLVGRSKPSFIINKRNS